MISKKKLDIIRKKHHLALILLHGSHVSGKTHPKSDLDIAVLAKTSNQTINPFLLTSDLIDALQTNKIDLANLTHADPLLLKTITSKCQLLSGSAEKLNQLKLKAFHRYNDYLPYLKLEREFVLKNL